MNKVFAIIVTYDSNISLLEKQYASLRKQVSGIVYVDNGSCETERIRHFFHTHDYVSYILNTENVGLGKAQNQAIKIALAKGAEYILLLDHDSVLEKDFVNSLLGCEQELLQKGIRVGAVGPIYMNPEKGKLFPVYKLTGWHKEQFYPNKISEVSFLISSGTLISKKSLENIGLLEESFFIDYIDVEWCFRAINLGYKLYVSPKALMYHLVGDSRLHILGQNIAFHSPIRRYYLTRNNILTFRIKYIPWRLKMSSLLKNFIRFSICFTYSPKRILFLRYYCYGLVDGIKGKCGAFKNNSNFR